MNHEVPAVTASVTWIARVRVDEVEAQTSPTPRLMEDWLTHSRALQIDTFGGDPALLTGEARTEYVRRMVLGLIKEATEALDEVSWKWWSAKEHFNRDKFLEELVDVVHFVGALAVFAECSDVEWNAMYALKSEVNRQRQREGY